MQGTVTSGGLPEKDITVSEWRFTLPWELRGPFRSVSPADPSRARSSRARRLVALNIAPTTIATGTAARTAYFILAAGCMDLGSGTTLAACPDSNPLPDAHFPHVVLELLAAVQTDHVALTVRFARLGDRGHGTGQPPVATAEQQVQQRVNHLQPRDESPIPSCRDAVARCARSSPPGGAPNRDRIEKTRRARRLHSSCG